MLNPVTPDELRAEDFQVTPLGGGWYALPTGEKVHGKTEAIRALKGIINTTYPQYDASVDPNGGGIQLMMRPEYLPPRYPALNTVRRKKVAVLGFTEHRDQAPLGNPEWEIWGINELYRFMDIVKGGFTRWFEIHDRAAIDGDEEHIKSLSQFPIPVYMQQHYDDIPPSVPYPRAEVEAECGQGAEGIWTDGRNKYFTSSIAWMLGLAILEGFEEMHIYGVDMAQVTEYFEQRPACEYLIGLAQGRGTKVYVPQTSDLLKSIGVYGFTETGGDIFRSKLDERAAWLTTQRTQYEQEIAKLDQQRGGLVSNLNKLLGAQEDCEYWKRSWSNKSGVDPAAPFSDRTEDPQTGIQAGDSPAKQLEAGKT
jgi:hypothetical protein